MRHLSAFLLTAVLLPCASFAQQVEELPAAGRQTSAGPKVEVYSGAEYQSIDLPDGQKATKFTVPFAARVSTGRVRMTAQVPYVRVTTPGNVVVPSGPLGLPILLDPAMPAEVSTREGLGDVHVAVAYDLPVSAVHVSLNGGVKLPTGSTEQGLGTGEADYWVGAEASKRLGVLTPFASVSYSRNGDPLGLDLRDTLTAHAGAAVRFGTSTSAHVGYSFAQSPSEALLNEKRVLAGVNRAIGERVSVGVYGSAGVAGGRDVAAGMNVGIGL
jgi:hypothetical protein